MPLNLLILAEWPIYYWSWYYYAERDHILMKSLADKVLASTPQYVILVNEKDTVLPLVKQITKANIPVVMLLNRLNEKDQLTLPFDSQQNIIDSVIPDNYAVGKKLLRQLVDSYSSLPEALGSSQTKQVLMLQGDYTTPAALARQQGGLDAIAESNTLKIIDSSVANWSKQQAYTKVKGILRHSQIDIIWTANDSMAFGAKQATLKAPAKHPVVVGGVNWDTDATGYKLDVSFGGHVTLGAKALILIHDYHHDVLTPDEAHQVIDIFESNSTRYFLPFKQRLTQHKLNQYNFSLFTQSSKEKYEFTMENLFKTFQKE